MDSDDSTTHHSSLSLSQLESLLRISLFPASHTLRFEVSGLHPTFEATVTTHLPEEWEAVAPLRHHGEGVWTGLSWSSMDQLNEAITCLLRDSRLCHPNIAELVDIRLTTESVVCCRALPGQCLDKRTESFSEREIAQLIVDVSAALIYANSQETALDAVSARGIVEKDGRFVLGGGAQIGNSTNEIREIATLIQELPIFQPSEPFQALLGAITSGELSLLEANLRAFTHLALPISAFPCLELTCCTSRRLLSFDFANKDWQQSIFLSSPIQYLECSRCTPYSPEFLAVCGLNDSELRGSCLVDRQGKVEALPHTRHGRGYTGLVAFEGLIYVFGGWNPSSCNAYIAQSVRSAERMHPKVHTEWTEIPPMSAGHSCFNPLSWLDSLFLCGGNTNAIEQFHPATLTYTLLAWRLPEGLGPALAVLDSQYLLVVTSNALSTVYPSLVLRSFAHERNYPYSNASPVLHERGVYFTQEIKWMQVDSRTGEVIV